jgi:hypothetical protein
VQVRERLLAAHAAGASLAAEMRAMAREEGIAGEAAAVQAWRRRTPAAETRAGAGGAAPEGAPWSGEGGEDRVLCALRGAVRSRAAVCEDLMRVRSAPLQGGGAEAFDVFD